MARLTKPSKHTVYYELRDACKKGGCPICTLTLDTEDRYLDIVVYEEEEVTQALRSTGALPGASRPGKHGDA